MTGDPKQARLSELLGEDQYSNVGSVFTCTLSKSARVNYCCFLLFFLLYTREGNSTSISGQQALLHHLSRLPSSLLVALLFA